MSPASATSRVLPLFDVFDLVSEGLADVVVVDFLGAGLATVVAFLADALLLVDLELGFAAAGDDDFEGELLVAAAADDLTAAGFCSAGALLAAPFRTGIARSSGVAAMIASAPKPANNIKLPAINLLKVSYVKITNPEPLIDRRRI